MHVHKRKLLMVWLYIKKCPYHFKPETHRALEESLFILERKTYIAFST